MATQYKFIRVKAETIPNLKSRVDSINKDIQALGLKKQRMKVIDFVHLLSMKPVFLSADELVKLAKQKAVRV